MDEISNRALRTCLVVAPVAALAVLAGCNESPPPAPPPPPKAAYEAPPPPPALLGAPPPRQEFVGMAPIPNPEDMTPAERTRVYGSRYYARRYHHTVWAVTTKAAVIKRPYFTRKPVQMFKAPVRAAAPIRAILAPVVKPLVRKIDATPPRPVIFSPPPPPLSRLATALANTSKAAALAVPADLSVNKPGAVTLSLPTDLFDTIRQQAAKFGLGRAARKTDVTATLQGDGYTITPNGPQTAHLVAGKPTIFTWRVQPGPNAKGPLTADVSALLQGAGAAKSFTLAELKQAVAAVDAAVGQAQTATHGFKLPGLNMLSIPSHPHITLPMIMKTPSKSLGAGVIILLVLFVLLMAARSAAATRKSSERRRRYRTMVTNMESGEGLETVTPAAPVAEHHAEPVSVSEMEPVAASEIEYAPVAAHTEAAPAFVEPIPEAHVEPVVVEPVHHEPVAETVVAEAPVSQVQVSPDVIAPMAASHEVAVPEPVSPETAVIEPETTSVVGLEPALPEAAEHVVDPVMEYRPVHGEHPVVEAETHGTADHEVATPVVEHPVVTETHAHDHHELETV